MSAGGHSVKNLEILIVCIMDLAISCLIFTLHAFLKIIFNDGYHFTCDELIEKGLQLDIRVDNRCIQQVRNRFRDDITNVFSEAQDYLFQKFIQNSNAYLSLVCFMIFVLILNHNDDCLKTVNSHYCKKFV